MKYFILLMSLGAVTAHASDMCLEFAVSSFSQGLSHIEVPLPPAKAGGEFEIKVLGRKNDEGTIAKKFRCAPSTGREYNCASLNANEGEEFTLALGKENKLTSSFFSLGQAEEKMGREPASFDVTKTMDPLPEDELDPGGEDPRHLEEFTLIGEKIKCTAEEPKKTKKKK